VRKASWAALAAAVVAAAVAVPLATAEPTRSQQFFRDRLLASENVADHVKDLLRSGGFVEEGIVFRELTGDGKDDAVLRVHSGGAPGIVAVYVLSTDTKPAGSELEPVFSSERLVRASTAVSVDGVVSYRYARYRLGNELCCPHEVGEATLRWDDAGKRFRVASRKIQPGPAPARR
jgi:hypothetical protein